MKLLKIAAVAAAASVNACTAQHGNNASDERVMHAAGAGVTVSAEEALAAARRANEGRGGEAKAKPATATVEVK